MSPSPRCSYTPSLDDTPASPPRSPAGRVGDVIVLAGEMGAGKTAFAQGFGRALGVDEPITSPTFTLVHSYEDRRRRRCTTPICTASTSWPRSTTWRSASWRSRRHRAGRVGRRRRVGIRRSPHRRLAPVAGDEEARRSRSRDRPPSSRALVGADRRAGDVDRVSAPWPRIVEPPMLILGIETATEQVGVAIGGHEGVIGAVRDRPGASPRRDADAGDRVRVPPGRHRARRVGLIAVESSRAVHRDARRAGPGKALPQALRVPMIGIPSLDLLAFSCRHVRPCHRPGLSMPARTKCSGRCTGPYPAACSRSPRRRSVRSMTSWATCWRGARTRPASVTAPSDTAMRSPRASAARSLWPDVSVRWDAACCSPTPRPARGGGLSRRDPARCICVPPMPRSTGLRSRGARPPMSVLSRIALTSVRRRRSRRRSPIEPFQMRHLRSM